MKVLGNFDSSTDDALICAVAKDFELLLIDKVLVGCLVQAFLGTILKEVQFTF